MTLSAKPQIQFLQVLPDTVDGAASDFDREAALASCEEFPKIDLVSEEPDAHWILTDSSCKAMSRCSLWWKKTPQLNGESIGYIGHYAAIDTASGAAILDHACDELARRGCKLAVGPIDGNTWRRYRLITERGDEPAFFMEPDNPNEWPLHFRSAGFDEIAHYSSGLNDNLEKTDPAVDEIRERMSAAGVKIRSLDEKDIEGELQRIYELSCIAFKDNFLYSPISQAEFMQRYSRLLPHVNPKLVVMAERESTLVGFMMSVPNWLEGHSPQTLVMKTIARMPGKDLSGLGQVLFDQTHKIAHELGYKRAIHALAKETNVCRKISSFFTTTLRGYSLYGRRLCT